MGKELTGFMIHPYKRGRKLTIQNELHDIQKAVGGLIEVYKPFKDSRYLLICDEEGKYKGLDSSIIVAKGRDQIAGSAFICKEDGEEFASLSDEEIGMIKGWIFWDPFEEIYFVRSEASI